MNSSPPKIPLQPIPFAYDLPNLAQAIEASGNVKIVALGSSTTAGEVGIVAYPYRLEVSLREKYANQRIDVINRGVGGEEAPMELARMNRDVIAEKPSVVIWQMGTNAVWQSKEDNPPSYDETIAALRDGIEYLRQEGAIDIILMDPQYVPAMLTDATKNATYRMVSAIADVSREKKVNLFRRFELMKGWHEVAQISFDQIVDPNDDKRLHDSDWATQRLSESDGQPHSGRCSEASLERNNLVRETDNRKSPSDVLLKGGGGQISGRLHLRTGGPDSYSKFSVFFKRENPLLGSKATRRPMGTRLWS
jgi:lysophospholipase L1-like esterase